MIAAALSIQDPRERPADKTAQADQLHARFADEDSDFLAYLNLWRYLRGLQRSLSSNQFRKRCLAEHLHHLRVREWQDLVEQLRQAAKGVGVRFNREPGEPREIHRALLSGLLSHVGFKDEHGREYQGARGAVHGLPGSGLARRPPPWVMVAELVETSRLWGGRRRGSTSEVEPLASPRQAPYSEPRWDGRRGSVVATERVTLYGLPIVTDRTVAYGRIDPVLSRELFIRRALVEGDWDGRHAFLAENRRLVEEVEALEDRIRRRDILAGDEAIVAFYDARIPEDVVSARHFDRWWRDARREAPDALTLTRDVLVRDDAVVTIGGPATGQGGSTLSAVLRFEPGAATTACRRGAAPGARRAAPRSARVARPGLREELVTALIRGCRRSCAGHWCRSR